MVRRTRRNKVSTQRKKIRSTFFYAFVALLIGGLVWWSSGDHGGAVQAEEGEISRMYDRLGDRDAVGASRSSAITGEIVRGDTSLLELPRLAGGNHNYFVTHYASGVVNYSLEYDIHLRHPRWVAFRFDEATSGDAVAGRSDAWRWDPNVPARYSTDNWFRGSGYSRGHLVASNDRQYSIEANEQTFYYTNVSPQLQDHNAGIWSRLEQRVQKWGRNRDFCDTLYVAKGGTIHPTQIFDEHIRDVMPIPRYYWMALLMKRGGEYHALGFLTEHRRYAKQESNIKELALSLADLESFTGLDFFYHLPDSIEYEVEKEEPNGYVARRMWWAY